MAKNGHSQIFNLGPHAISQFSNQVDAAAL